MQFNFLELIILINLFQVIILCLVLLQKNKRSLSNQMLILFLVAQIASLSGSLVFLNWNYSFEHIPSLFYISPPFWFIYGPSIFLFIKTETSAVPKFRITDLIHFIPAFSIALYFISVFHIYSAEEKRVLLNEGMIYNLKMHGYVTYLMIIHVMIYIIMAIINLEKYARTQKDIPTKSLRNRLSWNRFIIYAYLATCLIYDVNVVFNPFPNNPVLRDNITVLLFSVYFALFLYRALASSHFVEPASQNRVFRISKIEANMLVKKLENFMQSQKPYLEFNLTLGQLSEMVDEKERQISLVINQVKNQNFYDYVNYYRIEEVKEQIKKDKEKKKTILEILYACGFNSKSAFNLAFKKHTGLSPTQYRKSVHT